MWTYIETHPDVATNILDLISFIFVTPQLLLLADVTTTLISAFGGVVIVFGVYSGMSLIFINIIYDLNLENSELVGISIMILGLFGIGGMMYVIGNENIEGIIRVFIEKYLFSIGLGLFFISRLLAVGFAIYR